MKEKKGKKRKKGKEGKQGKKKGKKGTEKTQKKHPFRTAKINKNIHQTRRILTTILVQLTSPKLGSSSTRTHPDASCRPLHYLTSFCRHFIGR